MADTDIMQVIAEARVDARSLSEFVFKPASFMVTRRLAPPINTLNFYIDLFNKVASDGARDINQAIINSGFIIIDSFGIGATLTQRNQALRDASNDRLYRWAGDLPKVVPKSSTVASTGGTGDNAWLEVSDATLRQDLLGIGGASKIGNAMSYFSDLASFNAAETAIKEGSSVFLYSLHQGLDLEGEGRVYTYSKTELSGGVNVKTTSGYLSRKFDGKIFIAEFGATGSDNAADIAAMHSSFATIRENDGGILSMGRNCEYTLYGTFTASCSNLDWQFNGTTINIGRFKNDWQPRAEGWGNYKNIRVSNGIFKRKLGLSIVEDNHSEGVFMMSLYKVDNVIVEGNTFIEATYSGHHLDLMGCRGVIFRNNTVLGSCITTRTFSEAVQISTASASSWGVTPLEPWQVALFDGVSTRDVLFENNTFKPYTNPETGVFSYPPRPIGEHIPADCDNIVVRGNHIENVIPATNTTYTRSYAIVTLLGTNLVFEGNTVISNNGNLRALLLLGYNAESELEGKQDEWRVTNNTFDIKNPIQMSGEPDEIVLRFNSLTSKSHATAELQKHGRRITLANNTFRVDASDRVFTASARYFTHFDIDTSYAEVFIENNKYDVQGDFVYIHRFTRGSTGGAIRKHCKFNIVGNTYNCDITDKVIFVDGNPYSAKGNESESTVIKGNTFNNVYKAMQIDSNGASVVIGNFFNGKRVLPFDGVLPSGDTGTGRYINFVKSYPILLAGNYGINLPHDDPDFIREFSESKPIYDPLRLAIADYPAKDFNTGVD